MTRRAWGWIAAIANLAFGLINASVALTTPSLAWAFFSWAMCAPNLILAGVIVTLLISPPPR